MKPNSTNTETSVLPATGFLRLPQVLKIIPVSKSHWWLGVKQGKFPKGKKLSPQITVWKVEDIKSLIEKISNK